MDRAGEQFLARAAFTQEQYRRFASRGFFRFVDDAAHGGAVARHQMVAAAQFLSEEFNILFELGAIESFFDDHGQVFWDRMAW